MNCRSDVGARIEYLSLAIVNSKSAKDDTVTDLQDRLDVALSNWKRWQSSGHSTWILKSICNICMNWRHAC